MSSTTIPPEKAALHRAAAVLGGQSAVATALGYSDRRAVWPWFNTDRQFPAEHCPTLEAATREKGDPVLCEELRPDVNWGVLRMKRPPELKPDPLAHKPRAAKSDSPTASGCFDDIDLEPSGK